MDFWPPAEMLLKRGSTKGEVVKVMGQPTFVLKPTKQFKEYDEQWTYFPKTWGGVYLYFFFKGESVAEIRYVPVAVAP